VEIGGKLLVDGGIANNLPIDEARKLCGDVIIAVNISTPPLKREEITSALSVSLQLVNLLGKQTVDQQLKDMRPGDVLIAPELGDISSGSFERSKDAIRIGEEAARAVAEQLKRYSIPEAQYAALRRKQVTEATTVGKVDEVRFQNLQRTNPEVLRALAQVKPGDELTEEQIGADLRRIYGRGDFESVDYRIVSEPGRRVMIIEPREKSWGPDYLRFGAGIATDFSGDATFNLLAQYRKTWLNRLGGEWLTELQIGRDNRLFTEFYQPLEERGRWFAAPYASVGLSTRGIYLGDKRVAEYELRETRAGVDAGAALGTWGEVRLGPVWRSVHAMVDTGSPILPALTETTAGLSLRIRGDKMDHAWFPRNGHRTVFSAYAARPGLGSDRSYERIEGFADLVHSFGEHTFNLRVAGGTDLHSNMPVYENFSLGGPLTLSGYHIGEFAGSRMGFGRLMYYNRTFPLPDILGSGLYVGGSLEVGRVEGASIANPEAQGTKKSGSIFLGADSFLGPGFLGLGFAPGNRWTVYLLLGAP
jgi:NTE family protein